MKLYYKEQVDMKKKKPKLYALSLKYLSYESLKAVQKEEKWSAKKKK